MCFIVIEISFSRPKPLSRDVLDKPAHHRDKTTQRYSPRKEPVPCWSLSLVGACPLLEPVPCWSLSLVGGEPVPCQKLRIGGRIPRNSAPHQQTWESWFEETATPEIIPVRSGCGPKPTEATEPGNEKLRPESPAQFQTNDRTGGPGKPKGRNRRVVARTGIEPVFQP